MTPKRVLSIGQCFADHGSLSRLFRQQFAAEVVGVDDEKAARARAASEHYDLILVNRILDGDGSSGLDVIRSLKQSEATRQVPVMLVSNHEDAQREAAELGALPGFGKAALGQPRMLERLKEVLQTGDSP